ncbi:LOW QUALITY PROTEIN: integral membrane protein GPR155-like [Gadus morhua]|uniref:LOW QUALITY PROTEIN: integral membrane protein GPR155-like n=1 Tax=Gadus morhua TaxID=8049 RepID=UPI0011B5BB0A|nr:LOW QUALITY PROTEIN: integral membrane protein GPR155-like [Gadus morhua]
MTSANTRQEVEPEPVILPTNADDLETPGTSSAKPASASSPSDLAGLSSGLFGKTKRAFSTYYYNKYCWLEYSVLKDAVFCFACRHFQTDSSVEESFRKGVTGIVDAINTGLEICGLKNIPIVAQSYDGAAGQVSGVQQRIKEKHPYAVTVFALVCTLTLMVASPDTRYSKAGLYAIFATQSNDFALGYPIVDALYRTTYPEYLQYIYLVAPVSLMFLNPIGFALCEVQRWRQTCGPQRRTLSILGVVVLQVLTNPIVFMVVVGLVSHFALGQKIPLVLVQFIDGLADSFGGAALFYLTMVEQLRKLTRDSGVALIVLITAKLLVMPLICKEMVELLDGGAADSSRANHSSLSNFAFLYGVFPTAPNVALYTSQFNMELEVVTSGMVISTFLSAPIMYVSAWLLTIPMMDPILLVMELQNVSFNISIVCLIALVWTITVTLLSKKFNRLPHLFTLNLFLAQFLVCFSMILWNFVVQHEDILLGKVLTFVLLYGSLYSTYIWAGQSFTRTINSSYVKIATIAATATNTCCYHYRYCYLLQHGYCYHYCYRTNTFATDESCFFCFFCLGFCLLSNFIFLLAVDLPFSASSCSFTGVSVRTAVSLLFLPFVVCFLGPAFGCGRMDTGEKVVSIAEVDGSDTTHGVTGDVALCGTEDATVATLGDGAEEEDGTSGVTAGDLVHLI